MLDGRRVVSNTKKRQQSQYDQTEQKNKEAIHSINPFEARSRSSKLPTVCLCQIFLAVTLEITPIPLRRLHGYCVAGSDDVVRLVEIDQRGLMIGYLFFLERAVSTDNDPVAGICLSRGRTIDRDDA